MDPRDLMLAGGQRYERFVQDGDQSRLAKLSKMGRERRPNLGRVAWAWLRRLMVRLQRGQDKAQRRAGLDLGTAPR